MNFLKKIINKIDKILVNIAGIALIILMLLIVANVLGRTLFNKPIVGTIEFSGEYLLVIIVYFGLSFTYLYDGHISVTILQEKFSKRFQTLFKFLINILGVIIFLIISWVNFQQGLNYLDRGVNSVSSLSYPLYPALLIISLGAFIFALRMFLELIEMVIKIRSVSKNE